jgi:hypothetical protein
MTEDIKYGQSGDAYSNSMESYPAVTDSQESTHNEKGYSSYRMGNSDADRKTGAKTTYFSYNEPGPKYSILNAYK